MQPGPQRGAAADAKQLGILGAVFFVLKSNWGIGMMAMPFMLKSAGVVTGLAMFVLSMIMVTDSVHRLDQVQHVLVSRRKEDREDHGNDISDEEDSKHGEQSFTMDAGSSKLLINEQDTICKAASVPFELPHSTAGRGGGDNEENPTLSLMVNGRDAKNNFGSSISGYVKLAAGCQQQDVERQYLANQGSSLLTSSTASPHSSSPQHQRHRHQRDHQHQHPQADTYVAITEGALGKRFSRIAAFCICVGCFGSSVAYNKFVQDNLHAYLGVKPWVSGLSMALFLVPMQFLARLDYFAYSSMFGLAFGIAFVFLLLSVSITEGMVEHIGRIFTSKSDVYKPDTLPIALGIAAFSSEGIMVVWAPVALAIGDARRKRIVLLTTMGLFTLAYITVAIFGYSLYEDGVEAELTLSMNHAKLINKIAVLCYSLTLVVTAILVNYQTYSSYESLLFHSSQKASPTKDLRTFTHQRSRENQAALLGAGCEGEDAVRNELCHVADDPPPTLLPSRNNNEAVRRSYTQGEGRGTIQEHRLSASKQLLLVACRVVFPILAFVFAYVMPSFGAFIGLIGALMNSFIVYLFPNLMFIYVIETASCLQRLWSRFMVCYALITGFMGTYSAIVSMSKGG